jgi:hypothetical protein
LQHLQQQKKWWEKKNWGGRERKKTKKNKIKEVRKQKEKTYMQWIFSFKLQCLSNLRSYKLIGDGNCEADNYLLIVKLQWPKPLHLKHL